MFLCASVWSESEIKYFPNSESSGWLFGLITMNILYWWMVWLSNSYFVYVCFASFLWDEWENTLFLVCFLAFWVVCGPPIGIQTPLFSAFLLLLLHRKNYALLYDFSSIVLPFQEANAVGVRGLISHPLQSNKLENGEKREKKRHISTHIAGQLANLSKKGIKK